MVEKKTTEEKEEGMPQPTEPASMGEEHAGLGVEVEALRVEKVVAAAPPVEATVTPKAEEKAESKVAAKFAKDMGVDKKDVIASNEATNTVVTAQGGKFRLRGKKWMKLSGPDIPIEEDEDDE